MYEKTQVSFTEKMYRMKYFEIALRTFFMKVTTYETVVDVEFALFFFE